METARELLAVWDDWSTGDTHRRAAEKATAAGDAAGAELLAEYGDRAGRATALDALTASAALVRQLEGWRWQAMRDAREQGATWQQIGDAIGLTKQRAMGIYAEAIERQERHVPDLHAPIREAARAVAVPDRDDAR